MYSLRDPNKNELYAARAIVRTLEACGDNTKKKERLVAMTLRDLSLAAEDNRASMRDLMQWREAVRQYHKRYDAKRRR